jgi:hypothetical protein
VSGGNSDLIDFKCYKQHRNSNESNANAMQSTALLPFTVGHFTKIKHETFTKVNIYENAGITTWLPAKYFHFTTRAAE